MVQVQFVTHEWDEGESRYLPQVRATLIMDGSAVKVEGDSHWVSFHVAVVDPENGDDVTFESDPVRWARLLPLAYRSGDLVVETTGVPEPSSAMASSAMVEVR